MSEGDQPGQLEIQRGDPLRLTWHFSPTSDAAHTFSLTYRVSGAIAQEAQADRLFWRAIPEEHEYVIRQSSIRVDYPPQVSPLAAPEIVGRTPPEAGPQSAVFNLTNIDEDEAVEISLRFPPGSLASQMPAWQAAEQQSEQRARDALPFGLVSFVLTGLAGLIAVLLPLRAFRREDPSGQFASQPVTIPPNAAAPALAGKLAGSTTVQLGTLFDLARRGWLTLNEEAPKWGQRNFSVHRQTGTDQLAGHEQIFMQVLFEKAKEDRVALTDVTKLSYNSGYAQALEDELTSAGWRDPQRAARRKRYLLGTGFSLLAGSLLLLGGIVLYALLAAQNTWINRIAGLIMGVGASMVAAALVGLIAAAVVSTHSDEGARLSAAWSSFAKYLRDRNAYTPNANHFEQYLPYAAALGIATQWTKTFQKMGNVPMPVWFIGTQAGMDDASFIAILAAISAADSSAASAGASAGSSGGGSSGAG
ncbi:MAG: DUF2207 domain-containing protein, partial [Anaerolineae bacterium]|nr:DUF2207 domain-containing protein [Anaerolineae bacterium]